MAGASAGAAAAAAIAAAIQASGVLVKVSPRDFQNILARCEEPLVLVAPGGLFKPRFRYATCYKGFFFYTDATEPMEAAQTIEVIQVDRIWVPG